MGIRRSRCRLAVDAAARSKSTGASWRSVTSWRERLRSGAAARMFPPRLPLISEAWDRRSVLEEARKAESEEESYNNQSFLMDVFLSLEALSKEKPPLPRIRKPSYALIAPVGQDVE